MPCSTWKATSSPNVECETCHEQGVYVPGAGPAYGQAVAEHPLGLARGISREDRAFRAGRESYVSTSTEDSILLRHASVGLIGFGNLGRALRRLLIPFAPTIRVYDPWLPDSLLREHDVLPATLEETLAASQFLFVLATVTGESEHLLGPAEMDTVPAGVRLILVSRAAVVDYDALLDRVRDGRFLAGVDVRPDEPVPADCPGGPPARSGPDVVRGTGDHPADRRGSAWSRRPTQRPRASVRGRS